MRTMGSRGSKSGKSAGGGAAQSYKEVSDDSIFDESVDKWKSELSEEEEGAIGDYTSNYAYKLNDRLRRGDNPEDLADVMELDSALSKFNLTENIVTYRGVTSDALESSFGFAPSAEYINTNLVGTVIQDLGYGSTSTRKGIAQDFGSDYMFKINIPKGKGRGAYVESMSSSIGEYEFLLKRGYKLKITGATKSSLADKAVIHVDVVD